MSYTKASPTHFSFYDTLSVELVSANNKSGEIFTKRFLKYQIPHTFDSKKDFSIRAQFFSKDARPKTNGSTLTLSEGFYFDHYNFQFEAHEQTILIEENVSPETAIPFLESFILFMLCHAGFTPIHGNSLSVSHKGHLISAFGGTGKTRLLLYANEKGAEVISDDWTIVKNKKAMTYHKPFLMMDYDIVKYPKIASASFLEKIWFSISKNFSRSSFPLLFRVFKKYKEFDLASIFSKLRPEVSLNHVWLAERNEIQKVTSESISKNDLVDELSKIFFHEHRSFFKILKNDSVFAEKFQNVWNDFYRQNLNRELEGLTFRKIKIPTKLVNFEPLVYQNL